MSLQTPIFDRHVALGARMVDFGGWSMPLHYGSQIDEHHAVRREAGLFDVSHMRVVDLTGTDAKASLRYLLANDVNKLQPGQALYSCMLNPEGGVVDDLIVYVRGDDSYRLVINAGTAENDIRWMTTELAHFAIKLNVRDDLGILALQGPNATAIAEAAFGESIKHIKRFYGADLGPKFLGRTGYTGENGFEIILAADQLVAVFDQLVSEGARPCGLGARDSLRLEAGLNLYGQDLDAAHTPFTSNVGWTVALADERDFIGRAALEAERAAGPTERLVGLVLNGKGIMRHGQTVICGAGKGVITSGGFSPTLTKSIGLARIPAAASGNVAVQIRAKEIPATIVKPPFVRAGKQTF